MRLMNKIPAWFFLFLAPTATLQADQPLTYNRVDFQVQVEQQASNDEITVSMAVELDDEDAARLAGEINRRMQSALEMAAKVDGVQVKTGNYSIRPVHNRDQRLDHWHGAQTLILNGQDMQAMTALMQQLQPDMLVKSTRFSVSPARRETLQREMLATALAKFRERADAITRGLGFARYRLVRLQIDPPAGNPAPVYSLAMADSAPRAVSTPPALQSGWSDLALRVSGTIEMELKN